MTTTGHDPVQHYLARLDAALRDVPFGTAREIRAGIEEELTSLPVAERPRRIAELGDPTAIAAEASEAVAEMPAQRPMATVPAASAPATPASAAPASGYGRGPGYVVVTAVLIGIGGFAVPVLGWLVGLVLLWTGRVWTRLERWIATLAPGVATAVGLGIWLATQTAADAAAVPTDGSGGAGPEIVMQGRVAVLWLAWVGLSAGNLAVAIWLLVIGMRRTRG